MRKHQLRSAGVTALAVLSAILLAGCGSSSSSSGGGGGGGGGSTPTPTASIVVQPANFDFGIVTEGNLDGVPARRFSISNTGQAAYSITSVRLEGGNPTSFVLDLSSGANACGSAVVSLNPGVSCDVGVRFAPNAFGVFATTLAIQSNDPVAPTVRGNLRGTYKAVEDVNVVISELNACPRTGPARVFVSVTDEGGFPIRGLGLPDFSVQESGSAANLFAVDTISSAGASISLSLLMDYSNSVTRFPDVVENMEEAAAALVQEMAAGDEADVIKFSFTTRPMLADFTSDKEALLEAIATDPQLPGGSGIFDAVALALERIAPRTKDRKAVILLSDGRDSSTGNDLASITAQALEDGVPVFTVGFANADGLTLGQLAGDTGGIYYQPPSADNLGATYLQLANLLFKDQYILTYQSGLAEDVSAGLEVLVEFARDGVLFRGSGSREILPCPSP
jgi:Ca-activated chloride channel homolog